MSSFGFLVKNHGDEDDDDYDSSDNKGQMAINEREEGVAALKDRSSVVLWMKLGERSSWVLLLRGERIKP